MDKSDKRVAEAALQRLCKGSQISGIRFGPILQILLDDNDVDQEPIKGQIYLNLESSWTVFDTRPIAFPNGEDALPEVSQDEQIQMICSIRERVISIVELGEIEPHLILTLDDGRIIFLNGKHDLYECWHLGVAFSGTKASWLIVACPGGEIAVWTPNTYDA